MRRALLLVIASAAIARANGRPPYTNGVYFQANDPHSIYVRTTFGLLISHDDGCSFRWTCEDSIGYGGTYDPEYLLGSDGSLYATTYTGLRVSRDGACTFSTELMGHYIASIDLGASGDVWAVTSDNATPNQVLRSTDGGNTFGSGGFAPTSLLLNSVKAAPSDPMTAYVTGYAVGSAAAMFATGDAGATWGSASLAGVTFGATPLVSVAAIDPTNAKIVFVVSTAANPPGDLLYRSTDGGSNFAQVLATTQPITGVVVDGTNAVVASGTGGSYRSVDDGANWSSLAGAPQLLCVGKSPDGKIVGCGANWDPDYMAVAATTDMTSWTKLFRFAELDGVVACPAGTVDHDNCDVEQWPTISAQFGVSGPSCPTAVDVPIDAASAGSNGETGGGKSGCASGDGSVAFGALLVIGFALLYTKRRQSST